MNATTYTPGDLLFMAAVDPIPPGWTLIGDDVMWRRATEPGVAPRGIRVVTPTEYRRILGEDS